MKNYKILTLGASGSGKTVFLASMFKALSIQGEHSFYLEVEDRAKRKLLNAIYLQIITGDNWPQGTKYSEVSEWTYTCRVKTPPAGDYAACQFTYFDYAGGRVTDMNEEDAQFEDLVKQADTILGLLDGRKILAWMNGGNDLVIASFLEDLASILRRMHGCNVPIHFVISKWDLLENKFSLKQVRDRLLTIPEFEQVVQSRKSVDSPVRIIPVSSVGAGFATLEPDGSMKKTPGAVPCPFQVEVPVACVLPDALKAKLSEKAKEREQIEKTDRGPENISLSLIEIISQFIVDRALDLALDQLFSGLPENFQFPKLILNNLDNFIFFEHRINNLKRLEKLRVERDASLKLVKDEETSLNHAIYSFLYIEEKLEGDFPESNLSLL